MARRGRGRSTLAVGMDRNQSGLDAVNEWLPAGWAVQPRPEAAQARPVDVNSASFEALRSLGFSATQAKRFIAERDRLGGFRSIDQVDRLPGFPRQLKSWLRAHGGA
jgi:DNA uptake protein ComE-like DNA-binding protein